MRTSTGPIFFLFDFLLLRWERTKTKNKLIFNTLKIELHCAVDNTVIKTRDSLIYQTIEIITSEVMASSDAICDESKCISYADTAYDVYGSYSFTCYYNDDLDYPMMCANGYAPRIVDTEPIIQGKLRLFYQYFTCCPPDLDLNLNINVTRHCSNAEEIDLNENITMICEDDVNRPYPRQTASSGKGGSFMCCDSFIEQSNNKAIDLLNDTECVPFQDELFHPPFMGNRYGRIFPITCDNKNIYSDFQFPRIISKTKYECCKTGSKTPIFI